MDKDELIRFLDRRLKVRALCRFEREEMSARELEREFAKAALDLVRRQPEMAEAAGLPGLPLEGVELEHATALPGVAAEA